MTVENLPDSINEITRASNSGKLVFFIGAGLSKLSGYPTWKELVAKYYWELHGAQKDSYTTDEFLRIPQIFYDVKGSNAYDSILEEIFNVEVSPHPIHYNILALNPIHIITTNYDDLIEKTCWQRGKYYSHISVEEDVAKASSTRYLLKAHGDFSRGYKGEYLVLKESDYLDYEIKYPLINNLMKTIMATNTIVFIGYGLGDYNINLLLNWVKHLQKDHYNKPFFIHTDPDPIDDSTLTYYEKKGLRIIDSTKISDSEKNDYPKRYSIVMQKLIESSNAYNLTSDNDIVNHIFQKLEPLFVLKYIRKIDLKFVFDREYYFEVNGVISKLKDRTKDYLDQFFKLKESGGPSLSAESREKFRDILLFFERNNIFGMYDNTGFRGSKYEFSISSYAYNLNYAAMEASIQSSSTLIEDNYEKAFYLAYLGDWEKAYNLYSDIISRSIHEKKWWIYYLSQINRFNLYQSIVQNERFYGRLNLIGHGYKESYSSEFVEKIKIEMEKLDINDIFRSMPNDFQEKYKLLEFLSDNQFLYQDTVRLSELSGKIHAEINKGSYSFGKLTSDIEVQLRLNDTLRFLYENCLWTATSFVIKEYVRNSLTIQFEREHYDRTRDIDEIGTFLGIKKTNFSVGYYDFVNITKYFTEEELINLERSCKIENFNFINKEEIENYICSIVSVLVEKCSGVNFSFHNRFIKEAKTTFRFAKYINLSEETIIKIINAILFHFPLSEADIGKKWLWCDQICGNNGLPAKAIQIIEQFLISVSQNYENDQFSELTSNGIGSWFFSNLIHHFHEDYVSNTLSNLATELSDEMKSKVSYFYKLYPILSNKARQHLSKIKGISDISDVLERKSTGDIQDLSEYEPMIYEYLKQQLKTIELNKQKKIIVGSKNYVIEIAVLYFIGEIKSERFLNLLGTDDQFDFFVDPLHFDYRKFKIAWLRTYNHQLLLEISNNEKMKQNIVPMLKNKILSSSNNEYTEILIKYFI
jgi:hypothetical protein